MANYGQQMSFAESLYRGYGPITTISFPPAADRYTLLSFVEIDKGWSWLHTLKALYEYSDPDLGFQPIKNEVKIVAVVFRYNGVIANPDQAGNEVRTKFAGDPVLNTLGGGDANSFYIPIDNDWNLGSSCFANNNQADFHGPLDASTSNFHWNYIIGKSGQTEGPAQAVVDKWEHRTTARIDADQQGITAFNKIILKSGGLVVSDIDDDTGNPTTGTIPLAFDSTKNYRTLAFIVQRLKNLIAPPAVLAAEPEGGSCVKNPLSHITLFFSKPVKATDVAVSGNIWLEDASSPGGLGSLAVNSIDYSLVGNAADMATINLIGSSNDTNTDKGFLLKAKNIKDTYDTDPNPADPMNEVVSYSADNTKPSITSFAVNGNYTDTQIVSFSLEAQDTPGGDAGSGCGIVAYMLKNDPTQPAVDAVGWNTWNGSGTLGGTHTLSSGDGVKTVYAWVKDGAGNISDVSSDTVILDQTKPVVSWFTPRESTVTNDRDFDFTITAQDTGSGLDSWAVTESASAPLAGDTTPGVWNDMNTSPYDGTFSLSASNGNKMLYAWVKDKAGNVSDINGNSSFEVILDTAPPAVTAVLDSGTPTEDTQISISISASDATSGVSYYKITDADDEGGDPADGWISWGGTVQTVTHTVPGPTGEKTVYVWARDGAGNVGGDTVTVKIQDPRDLVFVLDYSGSMLLTVPYDPQNAPPGDYTKIYVLREAVKKFLDIWVHWNGTGGITGTHDGAGAVIFNTEWEKLSFSGGANLQNILPDAGGTMSSIENFIDETDIPSQSVYTAMGAGLADALHILQYIEPFTSLARKRCVLLITDGIQNRLPLVNASGAEGNRTVRIANENPDGLTLKGSNSGQTQYPAGMLPVQYRETGENKNVLVYALGIGAYDDWQQTLVNIAGSSGGLYSGNPGAFSALNTYFDAVLTHAYSGTTPQLVLRKEATYRTNTSEESDGTHAYEFILNRSVRSVLLSIAWMGSVPLTLELEKEGTVIHKAEILSTQHCIVKLGFPYKQPLVNWSPVHLIHPSGGRRFEREPELSSFSVHAADVYAGYRFADTKPRISEEIEPEGSWRITVKKRYSLKESVHIPYYLSVLAEESALNIEPFDFPGIIDPGAVAPISVNLMDLDLGLLSVYSAECQIQHPKEHIGTIITQLDPGELEAVFEASSGLSLIETIQQHKDKISNAEEILEKLTRTDIDTVFLSSVWKTAGSKQRIDRKSVYTVQYKNPGIPGLYQVEIVIRGFGKNCGAFERTITGTFIVKFKASKKYTLISGSLEEKLSYRISIYPIDHQKNPLGPGWSSSVLMTIDKKKTLSSKENFDGSYVFKINAKDTNEKTMITIHVLDEVVYSGRIGDLIRRTKPGEKK